MNYRKTIRSLRIIIIFLIVLVISLLSNWFAEKNWSFSESILGNILEVSELIKWIWNIHILWYENQQSNNEIILISSQVFMVDFLSAWIINDKFPFDVSSLFWKFPQNPIIENCMWPAIALKNLIVYVYIQKFVCVFSAHKCHFSLHMHQKITTMFLPHPTMFHRVLAKTHQRYQFISEHRCIKQKLTK